MYEKTARAVLATGILSSGVFLGAGSASAVEDRDCPDFGSQAEAQAYYLSRGGPASDPDRLDADDDGEACEDYFGGGGGGGGTPTARPTSTATPRTSPGRTTGGGSSCSRLNADLETVTRVRGNSFTTRSGTFAFDSNDELAFGAEGEAATFAQFSRAIARGTEVQVFSYCTDRNDSSAIALVNAAGADDPTPVATNSAGQPVYGMKETPQGGVAAGGGWATAQGTAGSGTDLRLPAALGAGLAVTGGVLVYSRRRRTAG